MEFQDIIKTKLPSPETHPRYGYPGFQPGTTLLEKGHVKSPGRRPFGIDTIFERDVGISLRDGVVIYTDIFRPSDSEATKIPAIVPWSPYGKTGNGPLQYDVMGPHRCGILPHRTSGYEKFEAPDPAEWCERGYAVVNVDSRGIGKSGGDAVFWGLQVCLVPQTGASYCEAEKFEKEAEDIYDTISWLERRPWCNGSVVMAGNSWLSISQINFASRLSHPALKAIAPWEGLTDPYRQFVARGGAPHHPSFNEMIMSSFAGPGEAENMPAMLVKHPLYDEYWESKRIRVENISDIPTYLTASYSTMLHSYGSFQTFLTMKGELKWLRVHPYQEWYDLYRPEVNDELQRFYDRYAKNIQNGWEETPTLRLSLLAFEGSLANPIIEQPYPDFPPPNFRSQLLFLDSSNHTLSDSTPDSESTVSYASHNLTASADFTYHFPRPCLVCGYPTVTIHVSTPSHNDMDISVQIRKISRTGELLRHSNYPSPPIAPEHQTNVSTYLGPSGFLRASHGVSMATERTLGDQPFYQHNRSDLIPANTVVRLEIPIWPIGMVFVTGEGIMLRISGHDMCLPETDALRLEEADDTNPVDGVHVVHTGGRYDSTLRIPVKYLNE